MANEMLQSALDRLTKLLDEGGDRGLRDVNAAALATADKNGRPSLRMINILAIEAEGLVFFARRDSGKGQQLLENPQASLCFYWPELQEQVILEGSVTAEGDAASDNYWKKLPRERQVFSWLAAEISPTQRRGTLRNTVSDRWQDAGYQPVTRHQDWLAFRLVPKRIVFWPAGWRRAQERVRYTLGADGNWSKTLEIP